MDGPKKRNTAYKIRIGDLLRSDQIFEESESLNKKLQFVRLGDKQIVRINIIANVIDKFKNDGEKRFASITLDDGSGQIRARLFGEDIKKFENVSQGDTLVLIGILRSYNQELYVLPEVLRKMDPRYLLIRKLELEKSMSAPQLKQSNRETKAFRDQIIDLVKESEVNEGIDKDQLVMKIKASPGIVTQEINKLIEDGVIFEPKPGRVRYLG